MLTISIGSPSHQNYNSNGIAVCKPILHKVMPM